MNNVTTKRALLSSVVALFLCFVMLIGTTFAWFTDEVVSSGNVIQTGELKVELWQHFLNGAPSVEITEDSAPIFGEGSIAQNDASETLWEPNKTQTVYLSIKNGGSLALKYKVAIEVTNIEKNLHEVMEYIISPDATVAQPVTKADLDWENNGSSVISGINIATVGDTPLEVNAEHFFALSVHMDAEAGNAYKNGSITFNIKVLAAQYTSESDSFDNQYDADATYPEHPGVPVPPAATFPAAGLDLDIHDTETGEKLGSMNFPAAAIAPGVAEVNGEIKKTDTYSGGNITIDTGKEALYFDIAAFGLRSDNDDPITVRVYVGEGYDPDTFKMYHYEDEITCWYSPETGYVTFMSATFSPFAVVYDADSEYVPDTVLPEGCPTATVNKNPEFENVSLPWGSYGQWSPDANVDADPKLEAAYTFICDETGAEAELNEYAQWHCDFVVVLDKDLGANQIFLGGNYGSFGWVGFHNGELELAANTEVPLLGSVTTNPWTYADVANAVGTFTCGVGDVNNALAGATFKVMLRLTNPDDSSDFINVQTITYTFPANTQAGE